MSKTNITSKTKYFIIALALLFLTQLHRAASLNVCMMQQFGNKHVEDFSFSPDNRHLAVLLWDNTLQVLEVKKSEMILKKEIKHIKDYVFSRNSNYLAVVFWSDCLQILDLRTSETIQTLPSVKMFKFSSDSKSICVLLKESCSDKKGPSDNVHTIKIFEIPNQYLK